MELICIDLEASGLSSHSYPIEIAWINDSTGEMDSFLINPDTAADWDFWDEHAEEMHGIDRDDLVTQGEDIRVACKRLNRQLKDKVVVSDAFELDHFWMMRLFRAADLAPSFKLSGLEYLLDREQIIQFGFLAKAQLRRHRALDDVEDIIQCIKAVMSPRLA
ncbi:hypothetical protein [uncultured Neptuniibacter sp.]|uniref:3'-5' exonuclease n=1 Tax=uncultured Neptuniibacter sp. TaxID=502143 RepID=UPI0026338696|nr:hypothetical protein [uncultured Neptuniibacter sp.]